MFTIEEQQQLKKLLEKLEAEQPNEKKSIDVSNRKRDKKGRFTAETENGTRSEMQEESRLSCEDERKYQWQPLKNRPNVWVKKRILTDGEKDCIVIGGFLVVMAILF